jgi:WD40 repeat protein
MKQRLRIFVSSPGDVKAAREIAALTIERLAQEYARYFDVEPYLWEFEAMLASGHFQDSIETPSAFDVVVLILWSRLGTVLPERTAVREYRGLDGRAPVTGTEWEFEEAYRAAKQTGAPDLLVYRSLKPAPFDTHDARRFEGQSLQLRSLNEFWARHFANQGLFIGAFTLFNTDAEFAFALESHLRKLIENRISALRASRQEVAPKAWVKAPFRGLESYEYEHAPIYFGQDDALAKAMLRLAANADAGSSFLLILGASGSGKSSLAKAGIVPKLFVPRRIAGTAFLRRVVFRPSDAQTGEDVFDAFARGLTTQISDQEGLSELIGHGQSVQSLAEHFRSAPGAPIYPLSTALGVLTVDARRSGRMLEHETANLVLVVDQLEELYNDDRIQLEERRRFVDLLRGLASSGRVWIIATMRKDFWHRADETPVLVRLADDGGRLELLPPGPAQISQMIRRPADAAGIQFELQATSNVPLNETIAEEVAGEAGALPLLSYLLDQLYRLDILKANGGSLTYATYERLGKLEGAIATQAEGVLERCTPEERAALGSLLFSLVDMGTGTQDLDRPVARRIPLNTFPAGSPHRRLVDALLDPNARLLVSDSEERGAPTVRVAHEALISHWQRAREFVLSNAEALKIRHRIEERYGRWRSMAADSAQTSASRKASRFGLEPGLLTDIDLRDGVWLLQHHRGDTESHLLGYIERSRDDNKRLRTRTMRALAAVAITVTILAIVASAAGWTAARRQHEAEAQRELTLRSEARLLTDAASQRLKDADITAAQGIILDVLTNPAFSKADRSAAIGVFQEVRSTDAALALLLGHGDRVSSAAYSPDGKRLVSASRDKTIRLWDSETGLQIAVLSGHDNRVNSAVFSPDGAHILSSSSDKTARIWDASTGAQIMVLSGHDAPLTCAAYSSDAARIVTSSADNTARIWDARSGAMLAVLKGHGDIVNCAAISRDGTRVVTASYDKTARIWDARTGAQIAVLSGHSGALLNAQFSPDGQQIVTASEDKSVRIWDARTGGQLASLAVNGDTVFTAAYSPDGGRIVTTSADRLGRVFDAHSGKLLEVIQGHMGIMYSATFSPDSTRIVTASQDTTARTWDGLAGIPQLALSGHEAMVYTIAYSKDGSRLVTTSKDRTAKIWDARTGTLLTTLTDKDKSGFQSAAFSPDGDRVVTAGNDKVARIWDAHSGAEIVAMTGHADTIDYAAYSPDGSQVATSSFDKTVRIWNAQSGAQLSILSGHNGTVNTVSFSPDGDNLVSASADKTAKIWDSRTGALLKTLSGHNDTIETAFYSGDGKQIVTASLDRSARTWDARTGEQLVLFSGPYETLTSAAFSPDGSRILTSSNASARIWDAHTGSQLKLIIAGLGGGISWAAFSPDGSRVATAFADKTSRIWDASIPAEVDEQILWYSAAQMEPLADVVRAQLGMSRDPAILTWNAPSSACDQIAAAYYDPDRLAQGAVQGHIQSAPAVAACTPEVQEANHSPRLDLAMGRALIAKGDAKGARDVLERAVSRGYRAANIDLASLLRSGGGTADELARATTLDETAWSQGVLIAAYELGRQYESQQQPDLAKAWAWYQKGADAGEPNALARFAERDDRSALAESDLAKRRELLLKAFGAYAAAAERAKVSDWPDDAWDRWRYRRATLARILASDGMMPQVAHAYQGALQGRAGRQ